MIRDVQAQWRKLATAEVRQWNGYELHLSKRVVQAYVAGQVERTGNADPMVGILMWSSGGEISDVVVSDDHRRKGLASAMLAFAREHYPNIEHSDELSDDGEAWSKHVGSLEVTYTEIGTPGNRTHITMEQTGTIPTASIATMPGVMGETPGTHRNMHGAEWEAFKADIAANGIRHAIFITVDPGQRPRISEGNHRRDAAVELGLPEVPVQVRYFGHSERQRTLGGIRLGTSWRPFTADTYWLDHDVTISSEGGAGGRKAFEVHVKGNLFANRPTLAGAQQAVEDTYGPLTWKRVTLDKMEVDHAYFGPTTEFTSPTTIWTASL